MFDWLFHTDLSLIRGDAPGTLAITSQIADAVLVFAYLSIPYSMWRLARLGVVIELRQLGTRLIWLPFKVFILLSGLMHLMEIVAFYWPAYRFFVVIKVFCAAFALVTALLFVLAEPLFNRRSSNGDV